MAEMLYLSVFEHSKTVIGYVTRYPITGTDSIYPSFIYLRTTVKSHSLYPLGDDWKPDTSKMKRINLPNKNTPFFDSMSVHGNKYKGLGADVDGDKCSLNIVTSKEAREEGYKYLHSKEAFINTSGKLRYGANTDTINLVLFNFSRGMNIEKTLTFHLATSSSDIVTGFRRATILSKK